MSIFILFFPYSSLPPNKSKPLLVLSNLPKEKTFKTLGNTSLLNIKNVGEVSVYIYWSWFFPVYKLSHIQTFLCSFFFLSFLTTPKTNINPFCSKTMSPKKTFKTLGNTSPSKALLLKNVGEVSVYIYTRPKKETPHIKHTLYMGVFHQSLANDLVQFECWFLG